MTPLITAEEIFPVMEQEILAASRSIMLSLHVFSPRTNTRSQEAHKKTLLNWGELIADALSRGVRVRILLNEFDPVGVSDFHAQIWERMAFLDEALKAVDEPALNRLRVMIALPGGQTGYMLRSALWPVVWTMQRDAIAQYNEQGRAIPPGLRQASQSSFTLWPPRRNFTQALHQKFLICDNKVAIVGGLDVDERRFDDPAHRRNGNQTWHDVSVRAGEREARQLAAHFCRCWRMVSRYGTSFSDQYMAANPACRIRFVHAKAQPLKAPKARIADAAGPVVATMGAPNIGAFSFGPSRYDRSLELAHYDLIGKARQLIYIESQYLRSTAMRDALTARMGDNPDLHTIVLLPSAPDVVAFKNDKSSIHRYGEWLQMRALDRLSQLFPDRFAAYCLTNDRDQQEHGERDALYGKAMVYIHSKVIIADQSAAIVSSANLNGRSMEWDYEAGIYARDGGFADELRQRLWRNHLGEDAAKLSTDLDAPAWFHLWRQSAQERETKAQNTARVGIVPFPIERTRRFSKRHLFYPQQMV
ncbi:MAG: phospholipase D family protein [Ahrensia sp.]